MSKSLINKDSIKNNQLPKPIDASLADGLNLNTTSPPKLPKKLQLQSFEGKIFELDYNIAKMCQTIKAMVEDSEIPIREDTPIKFNNISNDALNKIIEYANYHHKLPPLPEDELSKEKRRKCEIKDWDLKFVQSLNKNLLFELIMAANFLYLRGLIDLTCKWAANTFIKDKTVEEVRKEFHIVNDLSAKEETNLRLENANWAEEIKDLKDLKELKELNSSNSSSENNSIK